MISHVVLFKPRVDLSSADREALIGAFERAVREIPTVRGVRVGRRVTHGGDYEQSSPDIADVVVEVDFDDIAGLETYLAHPAHDELGRRFNNALGAAAVFDFALEPTVRDLL
jgi:hypothetical protein